MAAHVADLACAKIPEHVPLEAVGTGATGEVGGAIRMVGRGAEPEVVVKAAGRCAVADGIAVSADLAVAPGVGGFEFADGTVANEFFDAVEVWLSVALHAHLGGEFVFFLEPVGADGAGLVHGDGEGFFAVNVEVAVDGPVGDEGVGMVCGADDHGVEVFLLEHEAPIDVGFGTGEALQSVWEAFFVDIAEGDDVFLGEGVVVSEAAAPNADEADVEFVAWSSFTFA